MVQFQVKVCCQHQTEMKMCFLGWLGEYWVRERERQRECDRMSVCKTLPELSRVLNSCIDRLSPVGGDKMPRKPIQQHVGTKLWCAHKEASQMRGSSSCRWLLTHPHLTCLHSDDQKWSITGAYTQPLYSFLPYRIGIIIDDQLHVSKTVLNFS